MQSIARFVSRKLTPSFCSGSLHLLLDLGQRVILPIDCNGYVCACVRDWLWLLLRTKCVSLFSYYVLLTAALGNKWASPLIMAWCLIVLDQPENILHAEVSLLVCRSHDFLCFTDSGIQVSFVLIAMGPQHRKAEG